MADSSRHEECIISVLRGSYGRFVPGSGTGHFALFRDAEPNQYLRLREDCPQLAPLSIVDGIFQRILNDDDMTSDFPLNIDPIPLQITISLGLRRQVLNHLVRGFFCSVAGEWERRKLDLRCGDKTSAYAYA